MVSDHRFSSLVRNFTGQWLQIRDVQGMDLNVRAILLRDAGSQRDFAKRRERFHQLSDIPEKDRTPEQIAELHELKELRKKFLADAPMEIDSELRKAFRDETEGCFAYIAHEDRSVLELLESDYTFLNDKLAKYYGMTNFGSLGHQPKKVTLPANSLRGGILTDASILMVTSNPDRTSPVKRGLFVLENILGTPAPPPPANVPALEVAEKDFKDHDPTLRESLALHREKPLCASCHQRMDPLGLAFENFNAMGTWRETERKQPIDASGTLITGEHFQNARDLKHILATKYHTDFYRCLTEKFLTYALGRGLEYYDVETVDQIVARLEKTNGAFSALLLGVVESAPFQKMRTQAAELSSTSLNTRSHSPSASSLPNKL
jgi:hypothetical protein